MMSEQVGGHARHMACPKHQRFGARHILTFSYIAENDQVTEDLRKDVT